MPAFAVDSFTPPEAPLVDAPEAKVKLPPVPVLVAPAAREAEPPLAVTAEPTDIIRLGWVGGWVRERKRDKGWENENRLIKKERACNNLNVPLSGHFHAI